MIWRMFAVIVRAGFNSETATSMSSRLRPNESERPFRSGLEITDQVSRYTSPIS